MRDRLVLVHLCLQLLPLPLQSLETLIQGLPPVTIFRQRHSPRLIGIAHPLNLASTCSTPCCTWVRRACSSCGNHAPPGLAPALAQYCQDVSAPRTDLATPGHRAPARGCSGRDTDRRGVGATGHFAGTDIVRIAWQLWPTLARVPTDPTADQGAQEVLSADEMARARC